MNTIDLGETSAMSRFIQSEIASYFQLSFEQKSYYLTANYTMEDMMVNYANYFVLAAKNGASSAVNPT